MSKIHNTLETLLIFLKCFLIIYIFGLLLPELIDSFLFLLHKSSICDNSVLVNYVVDKNNKLLYNYIYIIRLILRV
jgi:hypothetical protein